MDDARQVLPVQHTPLQGSGLQERPNRKTDGETHAPWMASEQAPAVVQHAPLGATQGKVAHVVPSPCQPAGNVEHAAPLPAVTLQKPGKALELPLESPVSPVQQA